MESFSASKDNSADVVNTMRYLVNPMVLYAVTHNQEAIVTSDMAQGFVTRVLQTLSSDADSFTEQAQAEAIHLCTILLQHASAVLNDRRKEIIQYAW